MSSRENGVFHSCEITEASCESHSGGMSGCELLLRSECVKPVSGRLLRISVVLSDEWWDSKEFCSGISVLHEFSMTSVSEDGHC